MPDKKRFFHLLIFFLLPFLLQAQGEVPKDTLRIRCAEKSTWMYYWTPEDDDKGAIYTGLSISKTTIKIRQQWFRFSAVPGLEKRYNFKIIDSVRTGGVEDPMFFIVRNDSVKMYYAVPVLRDGGYWRVEDHGLLLRDSIRIKTQIGSKSLDVIRGLVKNPALSEKYLRLTRTANRFIPCDEMEKAFSFQAPALLTDSMMIAYYKGAAELAIKTGHLLYHNKTHASETAQDMLYLYFYTQKMHPLRMARLMNPYHYSIPPGGVPPELDQMRKKFAAVADQYSYHK